MSRTISLTVLAIYFLLGATSAQERVLAFDHPGGADTFRIQVNAQTWIVPVPDGSSGAYWWPLQDFSHTVQATVSACDALGLCAATQPIAIRPVAAPTNLRAQTASGRLGTGLPRGLPVDPEGQSPPQTPATPFPADAATNVSITPTLTFQSIGASEYNAYFGTVNPPTSKTVLGAAPSFAPGTLSQSTTYYWQGEGCNEPFPGQELQCTRGPIWSITTVVPIPPPSNIVYVSPSNGATGVVRAPTLTCTANDATSYAVRFDAANPPVTQTSLGGTCQHIPGTLAYSTTYYWRILATNSSGTTTGSIVSFTTQADPGPPPDPDPDCASSTVSPTGYSPMAWTPCRQDTMDAMEEDYLDACPGDITTPVCGATPATAGGIQFKSIKESADTASATTKRGYCAWMYQATANATYGTCAYNAIVAYLAQEYNGSDCPNLLPNVVWRAISRNNVREHSGRLLKFIDTIKPHITTPQHDDLVADLASWIQGSWYYNSTLTNCKATPDMNLFDSDQTTGEYFVVAAMALKYPTCAICQTMYAYVEMGGLTATKTPEAFNLDPDNARNAIRYYVEWMSESGEWLESSHYNRGTANLAMEGADMIKTITGVDHFPEITAWMPVHSAWIRTSITPDLNGIVQWGDIESSQVRKFDMDRYAMTIGNLAGFLTGTTEGRKANKLFKDLVATHGFDALSGFHWGLAAHPMWVYNPYDSEIEWRDQISGFYPHNRNGFRLSHVSNTDAAMFQVYWGGPMRFSASQEKNTTGVHHSEVSRAWGNWEFYHAGKWDISYILGGTTTGPCLVGGDGCNSTLVHGYTQVYNGPHKLWSSNTADFYYIAGTNGGGNKAAVYCGGGDTPDAYLHEGTRQIINLPGSASTAHLVIVHDRLNANNVIAERECYTAADLVRRDLFTAFHAKLLINHTYNSPSQAGDAFSWTTESGAAAKMTVGFPADYTATIVNEDTTTHWANWNATIKAMPQSRFHVRIAPTDNVQFNTFGTVHEIGTAGTINPKEDAGKVQGFHVVRAVGQDVLALFNSEQSANLTNLTTDHASHNESVESARFRESGYTITWTADDAAGTLVILNDLNPANTWTYTINGGGSNAITEDANGHASFTVTGTGAKTIVVTGS